MSWQDFAVIPIVAACVALLARYAYCASMRSGSGCSGCAKCRGETEPRRLTEISTPRGRGSQPSS